MELSTDYYNLEKELLNLLNNRNNTDKKINEILKFNIYLALLSLNNHNYKEEIFIKEHKVIDDFLRKVNNLKVKIQLKRKDKEITDLITSILGIYEEDESIIEKYNRDKLEIISVINSKDPNDLTNLIDKMTKVKLHTISMKEEYAKKRNFIDNYIFNNEYFLSDNRLHISNKDQDLDISLEEFYEIFNYLLEIDNYYQVFLNNKVNRLHIIMIDNLIKLVNSEDILKDITNKDLTLIILTSLLNKNIKEIDKLDVSNFKITNIKITDLYSFANSNNANNNNQISAKWNKVNIPNKYLYSKIKNIIQKGMYYYQDDTFILENIDNKISDFKVSISLSEIIKLINEIIDKHLESFSN